MGRPVLIGVVAGPRHEAVDEGRRAEVQEEVVVVVLIVALVAGSAPDVSVVVAVLDASRYFVALVPVVREDVSLIADTAKHLQSVVVEAVVQAVGHRVSDLHAFTVFGVEAGSALGAVFDGRIEQTVGDYAVGGNEYTRGCVLVQVRLFHAAGADAGHRNCLAVRVSCLNARRS